MSHLICMKGVSVVKSTCRDLVTKTKYMFSSTGPCSHLLFIRKMFVEGRSEASPYTVEAVERGSKWLKEASWEVKTFNTF